MLRALLAAIGLVFACPISAASARPGPQTKAAGSGWVPFAWDEHSILVVPVVLNGQRAKALVDTGVANVIINKHFADATRLPLTQVGDARSVGGMQRFFTTPHARLAIGDLAFPDGAMQVSDFSAMERASGLDFDVVIGASFLSYFELRVDFDHKRLAFTGFDEPPPAGERLPISFDPTAPQVGLTGSALGTAMRPLLVDTGSDAGLIISAASYDRIKHRVNAATDLQLVGGGGSETETLFTIPELTFGPATFRDVVTAAEAQDGELGTSGVAGGIGLDLLSRFNLVIDVKDRVMVLVPRTEHHPSSPKTTVGAQGEYRADRIHVTHVMMNSPAERAGLKEGDEICAVNGTPVVGGWAGSPMRTWQTVAAGRAYDIRLCSGRAVKLTTAAFY